MVAGHLLGCAALDHAPPRNSQEVVLEPLLVPLHQHCQPLELILSEEESMAVFNTDFGGNIGFVFMSSIFYTAIDRAVV